jgi:ABC-type polysaccharide/polyol phosphate export permease
VGLFKKAQTVESVGKVVFLFIFGSSFTLIMIPNNKFLLHLFEYLPFSSSLSIMNWGIQSNTSVPFPVHYLLVNIVLTLVLFFIGTKIFKWDEN